MEDNKLVETFEENPEITVLSKEEAEELEEEIVLTVEEQQWIEWMKHLGKHVAQSRPSKHQGSKQPHAYRKAERRRKNKVAKASRKVNR